MKIAPLAPLVTALLATPTLATPTLAATPLETLAAGIATHLAAACPVAAPDDMAAFTACVAALRQDRSIPFGDRLLWGGDQPDKIIRKKSVTTFRPDIFRLMYLPLFAFTGEWLVHHDDRDDVDVIRIGALFRNRLPAGEYPYPFWHNGAKWGDYEAAHGINLYLDAGEDQQGRHVVLASRAHEGSETGRAGYAHRVPPAFDGAWQWVDKDGQAEPRASLFSNQYSPDNPTLGKLDAAYKAFALELRNGTCIRCHTPANRAGSDRLVLLQTPVHAAAEIDDMLKQVRAGDMPQNDFGNKHPLDPQLRTVFLTEGEQFREALAAADRWEAAHRTP